MNRSIRGPLLLNVSLAFALVIVVFIGWRDAQASIVPILASAAILAAVNLYLHARTRAQLGVLSDTVLRLVDGEVERPIPQDGDEAFAELTGGLERLRRQVLGQLGRAGQKVEQQSQMVGEVQSHARELRATVQSQLGAIEETSASLHEMTTSAKQIAQSVETLAH